MRFDIMTLFPEAVLPMLNASILGRAPVSYTHLTLPTTVPV